MSPRPDGSRYDWEEPREYHYSDEEFKEMLREMEEAWHKDRWKRRWQHLKFGLKFTLLWICLGIFCLPFIIICEYSERFPNWEQIIVLIVSLPILILLVFMFSRIKFTRTLFLKLWAVAGKFSDWVSK